MKCEAVTEKLFSELTKDLRKVAFDMGHTDPSAFSLKLLDDDNWRGGIGGMGMGIANVLFISSSYAEKWWNLESSQQRKQIRGTFAHEVAHRILEHNEKTYKKSLETLGISVNSLNDVNLVFNTIDKQIKELNFLRTVAYLTLGMQFLKSDYFDPNWSESTKQLYATVAALVQRNTSVLNGANEVWINNEMEADLLMLRVSEYARGGRDEFESILLECEKINNSTYCDGPDFNNPQHPPLRHRVSYLTDALCDKYPSQNQDICQCSATDKQV